MGIMNLSPESFFGDGILQPQKSNRGEDNLKYFKDSVESMYSNFDRKKISIVDVGAESTSPYSVPITRDEETRRVKYYCLLYTSPSPRDRGCARMPSSA